ncbi:MAG: 50S ribosomal protein L24 [Proteobacteria bacterium]|nr:50S ribosomal protein L24 [Pseudomonadota bacterium]MCH9757771.1 50S ribosomal protein L24 [Pseudomonadota bacterium]
MNKVRRGDQVAVLSGRDKGSRGTVKRVLMDVYGKPDKVVVEGINNLTSFVRPNPQNNEPGGIIKREAPMPISKVAVLDPESQLPARVKITNDADGKKSRVYHVSSKRKALSNSAEKEQS